MNEDVHDVWEPATMMGEEVAEEGPPLSSSCFQPLSEIKITPDVPLRAFRYNRRVAINS